VVVRGARACSLKNALYYTHIGVARANERTPKERSAPRRLCRVANESTLEFKVARSKIPRRISRRNHRHRIPVFSCKFTPLQPRSRLLLSSLLRRVARFCLRVLNSRRVAPRRSFPCRRRRRVFCLSAGPCERLGISIRRHVSTAFFRMPRGRSEADETCRSDGIFFYDFSRFFDAGREMRSLLDVCRNRTYFECELFTTATVGTYSSGSYTMNVICERNIDVASRNNEKLQ